MMKKLQMIRDDFLTLEEGCNKCLDNCRARNLIEGTINHYRQSYVQFAKFFDMQTKVSDITEKVYRKYVVYLRENYITMLCNVSRTIVYHYIKVLK